MKELLVDLEDEWPDVLGEQRFTQQKEILLDVWESPPYVRSVGAAGMERNGAAGEGKLRGSMSASARFERPLVVAGQSPCK